MEAMPNHGRPGRGYAVCAAGIMLSALLAACGGSSDESDATPPVSSTPTSTPSAAPTTQPTASPTPTSTPAASPTPTPTPTASATPTASPAPSLSPAPTVSANFSATNADFPNPDRGFYGWSGEDFVISYDAGSVKAAYDAGQRLVMGRVVLNDYRATDLPASWLSQMNTSFAALRAAGMKATLVFSYDFTEGGQDASAAQIKRHLEQLKPVLQANADVIPYMRAGFIGAWGEWHSSKAGNSCGYNSGSTSCAVADANRIIVRDALLANVPATTQIGFRYPPDLQKWYPSPKQQSRVGMHNDCFLAGPTDSGTYEEPGARDYAKVLTANTAFGGETCENAGTPIRNTCADILTEGAQYHLAWLNALYAPTVLNAWKSGGCFDQVSRSMGYRLQLNSISHAAQAARGQTVDVAIDLRNVGWARMFSARKLTVTLKNKGSGATITASAGDLQSLAPQATQSTRVTVSVPITASAQVGDYDVYLSVPDVYAATASDPRFAVRFANADSGAAGQLWDSGAAQFKAGTKLRIN